MQISSTRTLFLLAALALGVIGCDTLSGSSDGEEGSPLLPPNVLAVNADASGDATGASWENAYTDLQVALDSAEAGDEVWIATGTYVPSEPRDPADERTASFVVPPGVAVYGGFSGDERERQERTPDANTTILSGDRGAKGELSDNAYHVVVTSGAGQETQLEGLTIQNGNANGEENLRNVGGGMYSELGELDMRNVTFRNNQAEFGGGLFDSTETTTLEQVTFEDNRATLSGGGAYVDEEGRFNLSSGLFRGNEAENGGGLFNEANTRLTDVTFRENAVTGPEEGDGDGGGLFNLSGRLSLQDVELLDNQAKDSGGGALLFAPAAKSKASTRPSEAEFARPVHAGAIERTEADAITDSPAAQVSRSKASAGPTLEDITFEGNEAAFGGGMYNQNTSMVMDGATFANNIAGESAGGLYNRSSDGSIRNVAFENNESSGGGGGMTSQDATATLVDAIFEGNQAGTFGGGINVIAGEPTYVNVLFLDNVAGQEGGGVGALFSRLRLNGVTITQNRAQEGGDGFQSSQGNRIVRPDVVNTIIWGNGQGDTTAEVLATDGAQPRFVYSNIEGSGGSSNWNESYGVDGNGNIDQDPRFAAGSARPTGDSPVLDAGIGIEIPNRYDTTDLNDNPRIVDGDGDGDEVIDMGAYEYQP
jgi:hypothetical protein